MSDYNEAKKMLDGAIGSVKGLSFGRGDQIDKLTPDQRLKAAEVAALLAIAQELSAIRTGGINPEYTAKLD